MNTFPEAASRAIYEPTLRQTIIEGIGITIQQVRQKLPYLAQEVEAWINWHSRTSEPAEYFLHPAAFPLFLLPWWAEKQVTGSRDLKFQTDLACATGNFYYYTRIVDNLMDNHPTVEQRLLPMSGYFMFQFNLVYQNYFKQNHPFWDWCDTIWSEFCDICAKDVRLTDIDEKTFTNIVSRKCCAGKISLGAVLYRYDRLDLLEPWMKWVDLYSCWHVLQEDLFDWKKDLDLHTETYILSEAKRRKKDDDLILVWLADEGFDWAITQLGVWMWDLKKMEVAPPETQRFLDQRETYMLGQRDRLDKGLQFISRLASLRG
ncbi:MAG TPA: hypothetical protein VLA72_20835 [Anaerolineales bacterium]|nr:hypothetical protein [Anaerolineales bacterium]